MNPLFQGAQANDAKDLVNFIIMTLHEELNIYPKINNNNVNVNMINQSNQIYTFNKFMNTFFKENKSIISDIFYGIHHTTTECLNCRCKLYNYENYFSLTFPLEEIRKYKLQNVTDRNNYIMNQMNTNMMINFGFNNMNNNMNLQQEFNNNLNKIKLLNENIIDIYDCFEFCQKIYLFKDENQLFCDIC